MVELTLTPARNGNFYVDGRINGHAVRFMIDTGATAVAVPDRLRWELGLSRGRFLKGKTAAGLAGMYETQIETLSIGPIELHDVPAVLYPDAADETVLLGMSALRELYLSQQNGQMILRHEVQPKLPDASPSASPAPTDLAIRRPLQACLGPDGRIDARVLRCLQGLGPPLR